MDSVERASRILARAYGYGSAWEARISFDDEARDTWLPLGEETPAQLRIDGQVDDEAASAISDALPVFVESETLERAGDSVSVWIGRPNAPLRSLSRSQRTARSKLTPEQCAELWEWEAANPLNAGQRDNPRRPREHDHWKRTRYRRGVQIIRPRHRIDICALGALAGLPKPLQAMLLLYATGDPAQWAIVQRFARARLPEVADDALSEGMYRLLVNPAKKARAKELRMRETEWDAHSRPALQIYIEWLDCAANLFLGRL